MLTTSHNITCRHGTLELVECDSYAVLIVDDHEGAVVELHLDAEDLTMLGMAVSRAALNIEVQQK